LSDSATLALWSGAESLAGWRSFSRELSVYEETGVSTRPTFRRSSAAQIKSSRRARTSRMVTVRAEHASLRFRATHGAHTRADV